MAELARIVVDVVIPIVAVAHPDMAIFRFLQQSTPALSFAIHANSIADAPGRTTTREHGFIWEFSPAFSDREILGRCFCEPHSG